MTTEEKADVMQALELGLILECDEWDEKLGNFRLRIAEQMNADIKIVEKAQEIMRLA